MLLPLINAIDYLPASYSYSFKANKELRIETTLLYRFTSFTLCIYLECSHLKLIHDNIIEALMVALIAII